MECTPSSLEFFHKDGVFPVAATVGIDPIHVQIIIPIG